MNSLETLTVFFGWCTALNLGFLTLSAVLVMTMRDTMVRLHSSMFGVSEAELPRTYFNFLAQYQIAAFVLSLAPYIALKIIA
jgi:hypothetical protein